MPPDKKIGPLGAATPKGPESDTKSASVGTENIPSLGLGIKAETPEQLNPFSNSGFNVPFWTPGPHTHLVADRVFIDKCAVSFPVPLMRSESDRSVRWWDVFDKTVNLQCTRRYAKGTHPYRYHSELSNSFDIQWGLVDPQAGRDSVKIEYNPDKVDSLDSLFPILVMLSCYNVQRAKFTRIDHAVDYKEKILPGRFWRDRVTDGGMYYGKTGIETHYCGSKLSDLYLRVYNKALETLKTESKGKSKAERAALQASYGNLQWWRAEMVDKRGWYLSPDIMGRSSPDGSAYGSDPNPFRSVHYAGGFPATFEGESMRALADNIGMQPMLNMMRQECSRNKVRRILKSIHDSSALRVPNPELDWSIKDVTMLRLDWRCLIERAIKANEDHRGNEDKERRIELSLMFPE